MTIRAGFVGLGIMGKPMARGLIENGIETTVFDVDQTPVAQLVELGARRAENPADLARHSDVLGICVRDDDDVHQVCFGDNGIFTTDNEGLVLAIHSTVTTDIIQTVAVTAKERGMRVVDAPVTGGPMAAEAGTLTYMVGGTKDSFETCRPAFQTTAKTVVHTGPLCTATYTKICNNLLQYIAFTGVYEAFNLLQRLGVEKEALEQVTKSNGLLNESAGAYMNGIVAMDDETVHSKPMQQYMRGRLAIAEKDLAIALVEAQRVGLAVPGAALVSQIMARIYRVDDSNKR